MNKDLYQFIHRLERIVKRYPSALTPNSIVFAILLDARKLAEKNGKDS